MRIIFLIYLIYLDIVIATLQEQWGEGHTHSTTTWSADRQWRYRAAHHRVTHLTSPLPAFLQSQPCPVSNLVAFSQMQQLALLDLSYATRFRQHGHLDSSEKPDELWGQIYGTAVAAPCNHAALNGFMDSHHWTLKRQKVSNSPRHSSPYTSD